MITQERLLALFYYADGFLYWKVRPRFSRMNINQPAGCYDSNGYNVITVDGKKRYAHRLIWLMHYGTLPKFLDHKDINPGNNKLDNLRPADFRTNGTNAVMPKRSRSGFRGVLKQRDRWKAVIRTEEGRLNLGKYDTAEEAAHAYDEAARKHHREFAIVNFKLRDE